MPLIDTSVPNLINGVSQQADALRFPSQCDAQINALSSVVDGLTKRPYTEHIGRLYDSGSGGSFGSGPVPSNLHASFPLCHLVTPASTLEKFELILGYGLGGGGATGTRPRVWRLSDGAEIPIVNDAGDPLAYADYSAYLFTTPPKTEEGFYAPSVYGPGMRALTLGDYTFIVNTAVTVALDPTAAAAQAPSALVFVKTLRRGATYTLSLKVGSTTYSGSVSDIDTDPDRDPASGDPIVKSQGDLASQLISAGGGFGGGFTISQKEGVIHITRLGGEDFNVTVTSTVTDGIVAFKNATQSFNLLPKQGYANFCVEVKGDPERDGDSYWVKFVADDPALTGFVPGQWEETVKPGLQNTLDAGTMPWALIYVSDDAGTRFIWKQVDWVDRNAGDNDTNPAPSFVGRTIENLFFWRGRFGFLSGENVIMSESNEFFNFYRTSVVSLLDSDPIDISVSHPKVSTLRDGIANSERLVLTCDEAQFTLDGGDLLTPKSASTKLVSDYSISRKCRPLSLGNAILIPFGRGGSDTVNDDGVLTRPLTLGDIGTSTQAAQVVFIVDTTGSMGGIIENVQTQIGEMMTLYASRYAGATFALKEYKDETDPAPLIDFTDQATIQAAVDLLSADGGDDTPEDGFGAIKQACENLTWTPGTVRIAVLFTDAPSHERGATKTQAITALTDEDVVFFVGPYFDADWLSLTAATGGGVINSTEDLITALLPSLPLLEGLRLRTYDIPRYSGVLQYFIQTDTGLYSGIDITSHVPRYIERPIRKMVGSETEGFVIALTDWNLVDARNECYVYRYYDKGGQRLQSSWSVFRFAESDHILDVFIINATVYFVIARGLEVFLEKMDIASAIRDAESDYAILLDRRITDEDLVKTYNVVTNKTTITLPYVPTERGIEVVTRFTDNYANGGFKLTSALVGSTLTITGDHTETPLHIGEPYNMVYEMTKPTLRTQQGDGSFVVNSGRFQVRRGYITYDNTLFFRVKVTPLYRDPYFYAFDGKKVGVGNTLIERPIELADGSFSFPVLSKNDQVSIEVSNDSPYPSNLLSVDWEALYQVRSQRV